MAAPHFCNVDLDIDSKYNLDALQLELGENVRVLFADQAASDFLLRLEISSSCDNPDDTIAALCLLLERLSPAGRKLWRSAHKRVFDVGYDIVPSQIASQFSLRTDTLKRMSKLGGTLGVTFYNHSQDELGSAMKAAEGPARKSRNSRKRK